MWMCLHFKCCCNTGPCRSGCVLETTLLYIVCQPGSWLVFEKVFWSLNRACLGKSSVPATAISTRMVTIRRTQSEWYPSLKYVSACVLLVAAAAEILGERSFRDYPFLDGVGEKEDQTRRTHICCFCMLCAAGKQERHVHIRCFCVWLRWCLGTRCVRVCALCVCVCAVWGGADDRSRAGEKRSWFVQQLLSLLLGFWNAMICQDRLRPNISLNKKTQQQSGAVCFTCIGIWLIHYLINTLMYGLINISILRRWRMIRFINTQRAPTPSGRQQVRTSKQGLPWYWHVTHLSLVTHSTQIDTCVYIITDIIIYI